MGASQRPDSGAVRSRVCLTMTWVTRDDDGAVAATYVAALLRADAVGARSTIDDAIGSGMSVDTAYLDVIAPAMREIGELWERAEITIADEHLATAITRRVLATLAGRLPRAQLGAGEPPPGIVVCGCGPEDNHALGAQMLADFFQAAGWTVLDLGPVTPAESFAAVAAIHGADVVAVSTSLPEHLDGARAVRRALDGMPNPPLLAVGGHVYSDHPERVLAIGADLYAPDPAALLAALAARSGRTSA